MKKGKQNKDIKENLDNKQKQVNQNQKKETKKVNKKEAEITPEEQLKIDLQAEKDKFMRLYAEFENFRKRTAKEKLDLFETAGEKVIANLLPVLDDFERALAEMKKNNEDEMAKGVQLIYDKLKNTLNKEGLKEIEVKEGDEFDPEIHEAIAQIPAPKKKLKNKIIDTVEKGYQLGKKIIRFPKVVTGK
jgi:molecular chaperone GrpE